MTVQTRQARTSPDVCFSGISIPLPPMPLRYATPRTHSLSATIQAPVWGATLWVCVGGAWEEGFERGASTCEHGKNWQSRRQLGRQEMRNGRGEIDGLNRSTNDEWWLLIFEGKMKRFTAEQQRKMGWVEWYGVWRTLGLGLDRPFRAGFFAVQISQGLALGCYGLGLWPIKEVILFGGCLAGLFPISRNIRRHASRGSCPSSGTRSLWLLSYSQIWC